MTSQLTSKRPILGVLIDAIEMEEAVSRVVSAARTGMPLGVSALAVHGVMEGVRDPELQYRLNDLEMVVPDGQPVRWALNWLHRAGLGERVYGPDLTVNVLSQAERQGLKVFFYGSSPQTLELLLAQVAARWPRLEVCGSQPSRFRAATEAERKTDLETIRSSGANLCFVGLGCPRQEIWVYENRLDLSMPALAVGAAFDFLAGTVSQAPPWMRRRGLEWLYRLIQEPRRLWRRYFVYNSAYLALLLLHRLGLKRIPADRGSAPTARIRPG